MQLLLGTSNKGKIKEMSDALAALHLQILTPDELNIFEKLEETGTTYAIQKAQFYCGLAKIPTIADDSGIVVEALANELGIHTRRWGKGADATDHEWIDFFLERMSNEENRKARFLCTLAYIDEAGALHTFEGSCHGVITKELEADYLPGLPISACFKPDGYEKVFSALSVEEKNDISHRGKALMHFFSFVQQTKE
jgi:XTP/dITP diphosphohydrolase